MESTVTATGSFSFEAGLSASPVLRRYTKAFFERS
jgi:hypothetical protein